MIVFAASGKGGVGQSVTSCNLAYRLSLHGISTAYVDFDLGSPSAGAVFEIGSVDSGAETGNGLLSYLLGHDSIHRRVDVRASTHRKALHSRRSRGAALVLLPGDEGCGEAVSANDRQVVRRCRELLLDLDSTFKVVIVDLSAGRSVAMQIALEATRPLDMPDNEVYWLVYHRWTRQHLMSAKRVVHGPKGLLARAVELGYGLDDLLTRIRFVRTAVPCVTGEHAAGGGPQAAWLLEQHEILRSLAAEYRLGDSVSLGEVPVDRVLQWQEQIVLDADVGAGIANWATVVAFDNVARRLVDRATWVPV